MNQVPLKKNSGPNPPESPVFGVYALGYVCCPVCRHYLQRIKAKFPLEAPTLYKLQKKVRNLTIIERSIIRRLRPDLNSPIASVTHGS